MQYKHFGDLLFELRTKYNMSREKLAQDICTPKQIYRIEKGESEPSVHLLHQLSIKFNLDLNEYYKMYFTFNSLIGLEGIKSINAALISGDLHLLKSLIEQYETMEDFKKGENLQHIYYGKALCSALLDEDYKSSLAYCYKALHIECPEFNIDKISENMYSNVGIAVLNCVSQNYFAMEQYDTGMKVLTQILVLLETFLINTPYPLFKASGFSKKIYQMILYNLGFHLYEHGDVKEALGYTEKGISFSLREYNMRHLSDLIFMKFKILYREQKYKEAKEYYNCAISLYKIEKKETILAELKDTAKVDFPEIFKEIYI